MFAPISHPVRKMILPAVMALSMTTVVAAHHASPASGLGQSWPNAPDVSTSTRWHVYRFERDGIRYIQVNDLQGTVRAAVAETQGVAFALPVGVDAQNVAFINDSVPTDLTEVAYQDESLMVAVESQSDGTIQIAIQMVACEPSNCSGGHIASLIQ
ncbi:hypothetical protein [Dyella sp. 2HG41-7]|uniref:hypothetical protein n=1 Tax=Dyella sp. 2HG41-7 TaxID=2883239 RepID=UPI001F2FDC72|nr:hypothetical protein [Dyella sp. 2HG41-7]